MHWMHSLNFDQMDELRLVSTVVLKQGWTLCGLLWGAIKQKETCMVDHLIAHQKIYYHRVKGVCVAKSLSDRSMPIDCTKSFLIIKGLLVRKRFGRGLDPLLTCANRFQIGIFVNSAHSLIKTGPMWSYMLKLDFWCHFLETPVTQDTICCSQSGPPGQSAIWKFQPEAH